MHGITRVTLGGEERILRFNMFSLTEMHKIIFNTPITEFNVSKLFDELLLMSKENEFLFTKLLVYTGIVGNDYYVGFKKTVTIEDISEMLMSSKDINLEGMWNSFFEASGLLLKTDEEKEKDDESAHTTKKKHPSPTKKRYKKPLGN